MTQTGSVRVIPLKSSAPSGFAIFSFRNGTATVAEAGVPPVVPSTAFRLLAELTQTIQTGFAVTNITSNAVTVTLELTNLDGTSTGLSGTLAVPANGQRSIFLNQIQGFASLQAPFKGVLRLSSSSRISVAGLRGRYNERNDFLITTTVPVDETTAPTNVPLFFPHIAD